MALWIVTFSRIVLPDPTTTRPTCWGTLACCGNAADHRPLEEMIPLTQRGPALDDDVAFQNALVADGDAILDNRKGPDHNAIAESCRGVNQGQRVNTHRMHLEAVEEFS